MDRINGAITGEAQTVELMDALSDRWRAIANDLENGLRMFSFGNPENEGTLALSRAKEQLGVLMSEVDRIEAAVISG